MTEEDPSMHRSHKLAVALVACGIAVATGLSARPQSATPTAHALPATVEVTVVDTNFDNRPLGSLPAPFVPQSVWPPCTTDSTAAVSDAASLSGARSLRLHHGCGGPDLTATGWSVPLPQYAPIRRVHLTVNRMPSAYDHPSDSYLGMSMPGGGSNEGMVHWDSSGFLFYLRPMYGPDHIANVGSYDQFKKIDMIWNYPAGGTGNVEIYLDDELTNYFFGPPPPSVVAGYVMGEGSGVYDDDIRLTVAYESRPTVVIDGCDTGVPDVDLGGGQTIFGLVMTCAVNATTHGEFESCVADLRNMLQKSQVISANQKGAIQSCAAQADIP